MAKTTKQAQLGKVSPATGAARAELLRKAQQRNISKASASITAADVWEFRNSEDAQSNCLVADTIADTMENCAFVLAFISDFHTRQSIGERDKSVAGLCLVLEWVLDAVEKQAKELEVNHG